MENCDVFGFAINGIHLTTSSGTSQMVVQNSTVFNNTFGGIQINPTGGTVNVTVSNVQANKNGFGVGADTTGGGTVSTNIDRTTASENSGNGIEALGGSNTVLLSASTMSHNSVGVNIAAPAIVYSYGNNLINQSSSGNNVVGNLTPNQFQ